MPVNQVLLDLVLQTAMHCDSLFVVDTFWDVKPVQSLMQQVWQAVVGRTCVCQWWDLLRHSVHTALHLVSNVSWWSGKNGITIVHTRHDKGMNERLDGVCVQGSSDSSKLAQPIKAGWADISHVLVQRSDEIVTPSPRTRTWSLAEITSVPNCTNRPETTAAKLILSTVPRPSQVC